MNSKEKTLQTLVPITSKNSASAGGRLVKKCVMPYFDAGLGGDGEHAPEGEGRQEAQAGQSQ